MSEDASYGMITIAVEDYEDGNQAVETPKSNTRGLVGQLGMKNK